ncbi:hypothetical protein [Paenibacillus sp. M2]|uniref:hypothetical protein n=1 Tax=Paenibacillus sp. M2 TaxID=3341793 RepID=UPI003989674D
MRSTEGTKVLAGEVIVPLKIEFVEGSELPFTELIRKVIREELAAHEERLKGEPEVISPRETLRTWKPLDEKALQEALQNGFNPDVYR